MTYDDMYISTGQACLFQGDQEIVGNCTNVLEEPFDDFTTNGWVLAGIPTIVAGRTGTAASTSGTGNYISYNLPTPVSYVTVGFAFKSTNIVAGSRIIEFREPSGAQIQCRINHATSGSIEFQLGNTGATLGTSATGLVVSDTWYYLEARIYLHDTLGFGIIKLNGNEVINVSNVNTNGSTVLQTLGQIRLGL